MPDYDIYAIGESDLTISGGGQLDGVTQGDGSHLPGLTITINTPSWQAISITDNDSDFRDNDGSQNLLGAQTFDGVAYADGTRAEAEYGLTLTDGTNTWTVVGFNLNNSNPSYRTVEGLAVIGGPGSFPPTGVPLTVVTAFEGPNFESTEYATPICFVKGTRILCADGPKRIERIRAGDWVRTAGHGLQRVRWVGTRLMPAVGNIAPVEFAPGVLGNRRVLQVSQQHRVLVEGWRAELFSGRSAVLVPAVQLVNGQSVRLRPGGLVSYVHILLEVHALVWSEGAWSESLYPGPEALAAIGPEAVGTLPLDVITQPAGKMAAVLAKGADARVIAAHLS